MSTYTFENKAFALTNVFTEGNAYTLDGCMDFTCKAKSVKRLSLHANTTTGIFLRAITSSVHDINLSNSEGYLSLTERTKCKRISILNSDINMYTHTAYLDKALFAASSGDLKLLKVRSRHMVFTDCSGLHTKVRSSQFDNFHVANCTGKLNCYHSTFRNITVSSEIVSVFEGCRFHQTAEEVREAMPTANFSKCVFSYRREEEV